MPRAAFVIGLSILSLSACGGGTPEVRDQTVSEQASPKATSQPLAPAEVRDQTVSEQGSPKTTSQPLAPALHTKRPMTSFTKADLTDFAEAALSRKDVKRVQFWLDQGMDPDVLLQLDISVRQTVLTSMLISGIVGEFNDSDVQIVKALLDAGANANGVIAPEVPETAASRVPVLFFVLIGLYDIGQSVGDELVDTLLAHGADVNLQTSLGEAALMVAAENNRGSAVRKLLRKGANVRLTRSDGKTAESIARDSGFRNIADMIASYQSDRQLPR